MVTLAEGLAGSTSRAPPPSTRWGGIGRWFPDVDWPASAGRWSAGLAGSGGGMAVSPKPGSGVAQIAQTAAASGDHSRRLGHGWSEVRARPAKMGREDSPSKRAHTDGDAASDDVFDDDLLSVRRRRGLPVLMLSHSLGQDHSMWDAQAAALSSRFRVLRYDTRGHGASASRPATKHRGAGRRRPRAGRRPRPPHVRVLRPLARRHDRAMARRACRRPADGAGSRQHLAARRMPTGWRSAGRSCSARHVRHLRHRDGALLHRRRSLAANPPAVAGARRTLLATDPRGYAGCCAAIRDMDQTAILSAIRVPTLVISGELDVSLPWKGHSEVLAQRDSRRAGRAPADGAPVESSSARARSRRWCVSSCSRARRRHSRPASAPGAPCWATRTSIAPSRSPTTSPAISRRC